MAGKKKIRDRGQSDPLAELGDIEGGLRKLGPSQPMDLQSDTGGGVSKATGKKIAKALSETSPFTLKREPRSTPKGDRLAAPAVQTKGTEPMAEKIFQHAEQERSPDYPMATDPVFGPADPELTKALVPQVSIADRLPPMPQEGEWPEGGRAQQIWENREAIGQRMADDLTAAPGKPLPFYSTGSVLQGLTDRAGLSPEQSLDFMGRWSGQGAATSPRTATPQNLRNASYLLYRRGQGDPLTKARQKEEQESGLWGFDKKGKPNLNRPGFAMMGMHTQLGDEFWQGTNDLLKNPKPGTFQPNWMGNMADVTGDTHNIRKVLDTFDQLFPGQLQREWFDSPEAYETYRGGGGFPKEGVLPVGDIKDTLGGITRNKQEMQTEYPVMTAPTYETAKILGIAPAEAQERLWFEGGPRTGLKSPPMTIPDLLNAQIEKTARVLGIDPVQVMKIWSKHGIPLAAADDMNVPGQSAVG